MARPIITLTTDFGLQDAYVGIMKGVILGIAPDAEIVDLAHEIPAQSIESAAYLLETSVDYFPAGTVHLAVVDPGVGTARLPLAVATERATFVGPDNGLLHPVLANQDVVSWRDGALRSATAVQLADSKYRLRDVSATFHGRDIFAPAAAHIARGTPVERLGPRLSSILPLPHHTATDERGTIVGAVVYVDRFGNLISNIRADQLPACPVVEADATTITGLAGSYQDGDAVALVNSAGRLEIAVRNGSAAARLNLGTGSRVVVRCSQ